MLTRVRKHFATRFPSRPNTSDTILVKSAGRLVFVPYRTLEFVKARANYVRLVAGANEYDVREKIGDLEKRLHSERFLRIHRSYIVNVACISELTPTGDGDYLLTLQSGRHLPVGPTYTPALRRYMQDLGLSFLQEFGPRRIKTFSSV
jgi:DNA-binding LytR/AlgR family response regulator